MLRSVQYEVMLLGGASRLLSGGASSRAIVRLNSATRTHLSQQFRVLQIAALKSPLPLNTRISGAFLAQSFKNYKSFPHNLTSLSRSMAATSQIQTRSHMGHSHHHHHHDNTFLVSKNKNDAGVRITRIGLICNLGMAIVKFVGGYMFNSKAMIADAWHSLSDLASDILTLATVSWSLKPPNALFPLGFGKIESLGALGVSGMLLFGGCFMCLNSCEALYANLFLDAHAAAEFVAHSHGHSHNHSHGHDGPSLHAAWLSAGTVVIKEWLYQASEYLLSGILLSS